MINYLEQMSVGTVNLISVLGLIVGLWSLYITFRAYCNTKKIKAQIISKKITQKNILVLSRHKSSIKGMVSAIQKDTEINNFEIHKLFTGIVTSLSVCKRDFISDKTLNEKYQMLINYSKDIKEEKYTDNKDIIEILITSQKALEIIIEYLKS